MKYVDNSKTGSVNDLTGMFAHDGPAITLEEMDDAIAAGATASVGADADPVASPDLGPAGDENERP